MYSRHRERRRNARKEMKKLKINRETFERLSKTERKKERFEKRRDVSTRHLCDAKSHRK